MTIDLRRFLPADLREPYASRVEKPRERISDRRDWYSIRALAGSNSADIYVYDEIGFWGVTASDFVAELMSLRADTLNVHINSPGGDVFDGIAIHSALISHPATVNVHIDALAASIASVIAMAGKTITAAKGSMMMVHDASGVCFGNAADMLATAAILDRCSDVIAGFYADRTGGDVADWRGVMRAETWYTGPEAVAAKLADQLAGSPEIEVPPTPEPPEPDEAGEQVDGRMAATFDPAVYGYRGPLYTVSNGGHTGADGLDIQRAPADEWAFDVDAFRAAMLDGARSGLRPDDEDFAFNPDVFRNAVREARN
jgi:ATP-dependent protease ClpP protease subunit